MRLAVLHAAAIKDRSYKQLVIALVMVLPTRLELVLPP